MRNRDQIDAYHTYVLSLGENRNIGIVVARNSQMYEYEKYVEENCFVTKDLNLKTKISTCMNN